MASVAKIQATVLTTAVMLSLALAENEIIPSKMSFISTSWPFDTSLMFLK